MLLREQVWIQRCRIIKRTASTSVLAPIVRSTESAMEADHESRAIKFRICGLYIHYDHMEKLMDAIYSI